ncbi:hypothetical protein [Metabacillus sp. Hm71]|uniref:hypothetical protein n=1 Tax=Metabacillus sp. Hm71 TaxID=3450743 RepID=UPI003F4353E1
MGVWESSGVEKNFEELIEEVNKVKSFAMKKIEKLENSTNIKKVQQLKTTWLNKTQVRTREDSSWFSKNKYIMLSVPKDFYEKLDNKEAISIFKTNDRWNDVDFKVTISEENKEKLVEFKKILDVIYDADQVIHNENLRIVEENKQLEAAIFGILDQAGIRRSYYGYKTNRSSKKTEQHYHFSSEIRGQIPTFYSKNSLDERKKTLLQQIDKYWNNEITKIIEERRKKEQEQKEKEQNRKLALLLAKYDLSLDDDWEDILDKIINKNKYLYLAHYLYKNRNDWTSGYSYAETGLGGFSVENELDQKIYDNIQYHIDNWDMDGRIFRDCEYNYDVLFGMVEDSDLMSDYETTNENLPDLY